MPLVPGARPSRASAARNDTSAFNRASAAVRAGTATVPGVSDPRSSAIAPRFTGIVTSSQTTSALPSSSPKTRRGPVSNTRKRMPAGPFSTSPFALDPLILNSGQEIVKLGRGTNHAGRLSVADRRMIGRARASDGSPQYDKLDLEELALASRVAVIAGRSPKAPRGRADRRVLHYRAGGRRSRPVPQAPRPAPYRGCRTRDAGNERRAGRRPPAVLRLREWSWGPLGGAGRRPGPRPPRAYGPQQPCAARRWLPP